MSDKKKTVEKKDSNLKNLEDQVVQYLAGWQKALADYQNLQKEMNKKITDLGEFISSDYILELLPIFDNYQIALSHIPESEKKKQWAIGLEHILKMWEVFLSEHNAQRIKALGEKFDPNIHEAIGEVEDKHQADQIIVEEKLAGYKIKHKVIRPAKVIINNLK
jgi:molecular chaperone GrpE